MIKVQVLKYLLGKRGGKRRSNKGKITRGTTVKQAMEKGWRVRDIEGRRSEEMTFRILPLREDRKHLSSPIRGDGD